MSGPVLRWFQIDSMRKCARLVWVQLAYLLNLGAIRVVMGRFGGGMGLSRV